MPDLLTLDELSRRTGEPAARLEEWQRHRLIGREAAFTAADVRRARLIHDLLHYGHSLDAIAAAFERPDSAVQHVLKEHKAELEPASCSLAEAAETARIDLPLARRLIDAAGIVQPGEMVDAEDIDFFRACRVALDAGYPEEGLLQILRVYADAMSRAAEVSSRTTHFYLHQPLVAEGLPGHERWDRLHDTSGKTEPLVEPALMYFFHKGAARAAWDDLLMHLEEEAGLADPPDAPGQIRQAIMFADLSSFTPLAEAMGDIKAAQVLERFDEFVRMAVRRCHGRIVKQIGDAFMIVFPECYSAVSCALELDERACAEPQFPAVRSGVHWGPVLYRQGDYLGSNVNIASRLGSEAERHQVLVTDEVRRRAKGLEGVEFLHLGRRRLKGLAAEVDVFEARGALTGSEPAKAIDPVCGMELGPPEVVARLTLDGEEHAFCSDDCLRRFVASPEKYA